MHDVLVIGGGVAGLQAAVYTAKANLDTLVLDSDQSLVRNTDIIQNLVTHETIADNEIIETGHERVAGLGGTVETATVTALNRDDTPGPLMATTEDGAEHTGRRVVVATASELNCPDPLNEELGYKSGRKGDSRWSNTSRQTMRTAPPTVFTPPDSRIPGSIRLPWRSVTARRQRSTLSATCVTRHTSTTIGDRTVNRRPDRSWARRQLLAVHQSRWC